MGDSGPRNVGAAQGSDTTQRSEIPPRSDTINIATLAAGGIAVVSATAAIYGAFTGTVARLARNHPWVIPLALVIVFLAVGAALIAARLPTTARANPSPRATVLLMVSLLLFGGAAFLTAWGLSDVLSKVDRPRINAKWAVVNGQTVLMGTVAGSGFAASDQLTVNIVRLLNNGDPSPSPPPSPSPTPEWIPPDRAKWVYPRGIVYQQTTGPDIDGNVTIAFEVPLPPGYNGMLVVASTTGATDCPSGAPTDTSESPSAAPSGAQQAGGPDQPYACLILDAPPTFAQTPGRSNPPAAQETPR